MIKQGPYYE